MSTHVALAHRRGATLIAFTMVAAVALMVGNTAGAAIVPTVPLATAANYAVLGASTVTNTGNSTLDGSLGLWPGTSITGFPPGQVLPPGTTDTTNAAAKQAQSDLTAAYVNAAGRPVDFTTTSDLANKHLGAGVYSGPSKSPLGLSGPLVLDGAGDSSSVFIFQTDSTLITGSGSTVTLVNGAKECNVFWQVGSSATLGTGSVFTGNILALTSITVTNSVTVHGRALARNGAVTLDNDTFTKTNCTPLTPVGRPPSGPGPGGSGPPVGLGPGGSGPGPGGSGPTTPVTAAGGGPTTTIALPHTPIALTSGGPGVPGVVGPPRTGGAPLRTATFPWLAVLLATMLGGALTVGGLLTRRAQTRGGPAAGR
jgi:hypothetical protein